jgi:hypothetical protein
LHKGFPPMAKAKKTETTAAADKKPAAKAAQPKVAAKKAPAKPASAGAAGMPQIDTNLAAQNAAQMLVNRPAASAGPAGDKPKQETSAFKNMKDQLAKKTTGMGHLFGPASDNKKGGNHFTNQQKGHNQTQGGFNKTGVPRRTNG